MTLGLWPPILSQVALEMDVPITLGSAGGTSCQADSLGWVSLLLLPNSHPEVHLLAFGLYRVLEPHTEGTSLDFMFCDSSLKNLSLFFFFFFD